MRKRDTKLAKNEADRLRLAGLRKEVKPSRLRAMLRTRIVPSVLREAPAMKRVAGHPRAWSPAAHDLVGIVEWGQRTVLGVNASAVEPMLGLLAPLLLAATGAVLASRGSDGGGPRRGGSVILSLAKGSSGAHKDGTDTLLLNVSGRREVWFAPPAAVTVPVALRNGGNGQGPIFLPNTCDPSRLTLAQCAAAGAHWCPSVTLEAGDALWIREGWWHCIESQAGGVAVPVEIQSGSIRGEAPCVFRRVAQRKPAGGDSGQLVSRAVGWGSAAKVLELWEPALTVLAFKEKLQSEEAKLVRMGLKAHYHSMDAGGTLCSSFERNGLPCRSSRCCSKGPCSDWATLLKSDLKATLYASMPNVLCPTPSRRVRGIVSLRS
jgi:hypothetical protein